MSVLASKQQQLAATLVISRPLFALEYEFDRWPVLTYSVFKVPLLFPAFFFPSFSPLILHHARFTFLTFSECRTFFFSPFDQVFIKTEEEFTIRSGWEIIWPGLVEPPSFSTTAVFFRLWHSQLEVLSSFSPLIDTIPHVRRNRCLTVFIGGSQSSAVLLWLSQSLWAMMLKGCEGGLFPLI